MTKKLAGWQLVNGVWTQVWPSVRYDYRTGQYNAIEMTYPEPAITLATITEIERAFRPGQIAFDFMRYY